MVLIDAPMYLAPLPRFDVGAGMRSWVDAATVVSHGLMWATALAGPLLPAEAATNTPASDARKNACSTGSLTVVC